MGKEDGRERKSMRGGGAQEVRRSMSEGRIKKGRRWRREEGGEKKGNKVFKMRSEKELRE